MILLFYIPKVVFLDHKLNQSIFVTNSRVSSEIHKKFKRYGISVYLKTESIKLCVFKWASYL